MSRLDSEKLAKEQDELATPARERAMEMTAGNLRTDEAAIS